MRYYLIFILTLLLISCGKAPIVDPILLPYIQRYEAETGESLANLDVVFNPTLRPIVSVCINQTRIEVDRAYYDTLTDLGREQMIYHEIGHCHQGLSHDSSRVIYKGADIPASIMNPEVFGEEWCYAELRNTYKAALRQGRGIRQDEL